MVLDRLAEYSVHPRIWQVLGSFGRSLTRAVSGQSWRVISWCFALFKVTLLFDVMVTSKYYDALIVPILILKFNIFCKIPQKPNLKNTFLTCYPDKHLQLSVKGERGEIPRDFTFQPLLLFQSLATNFDIPSELKNLSKYKIWSLIFLCTTFFASINTF